MKSSLRSDEIRGQGSGYIPSITIPVRQGRNLAVIVEVAAMNNRQKRMGFNAARELNERLMDNALEKQKK